MSINDVISAAAGIAGIPGLDIGIDIASGMAANIENVKVYRRQCADLSNRCASLLVALRESSTGMGSTEALRAADEVESTIRTIHRRMQNWSTLSRVKSFVKQSEIKEGIDASYRAIDACAMQFNVSVSMEQVRGQQDLVSIQERDQAELLQLLQNILKNQDELKIIKQMGTPEVEGFMQSIQEELLRKPTAGSSSVDLQEQQQPHALRQGLWELHQATNQLPPMIDLTGQVVKTEEEPVACGAFNDIYAGLWLDEEKVALRFSRAFVNNPVAQHRFLKEVEIWRRLQHPNVTRLYGIAYFGKQIYSVSKWMGKGNAITYVQQNPDADRLKILSEVAIGMEYLHTHVHPNIVHGDLRGANVLISESGRACLSDFGLSKVLEAAPPGTQSAAIGATAYRWLAPELIDLSGETTTPVSTYTDVWSFGMLCLEVMTGQAPFPNINRDITVAFELVRGRLPDRPNVKGLSDGLWDLMMHCWNKNPKERPSMTDIRLAIRQLRLPPGSGPLPTRTSLDNGPSPTSSRPPAPVAVGSSAARRASEASTQTLRKGQTSSSRPSTSSGPNTSRTTPDLHMRSYSSTSQMTENSKGSILTSRLNQISQSPPSESLLLSPEPTPEPTTDTDAGEADWGILGDLLGYSSKSTAFRRNTASLGERPTIFQSAHNRGPSQPIKIPRSESARQPSFDDHLNGHNGGLSSSLPARISPSLLPHTPSTESNAGSSGQSISSKSNSLEMAVNDPAALIQHARDGSVDSGTLEGLVDRLITDSKDFRKDTEYRRIFIATYLAFTTSENLFATLVRRYDEVEKDPKMTAKDRSILRYSVLTVIKQWLASAQININVLSGIQDFCASVQSSGYMKELASEVSSKVIDRIAACQKAGLMSPVSSSFSSSAVVKPEAPIDLAQALSITEGDLYSRIIQDDYLAYFKNIGGQTPIDAALVKNRTIMNWIKKSILRSEDVEVRASTLKFFINAAEECRLLKNFASWATIMKALNSLTISRLRITREKVTRTKQMDRLWQKLSTILDDKDDHRVYRSVLREAKNECIPWLGASQSLCLIRTSVRSIRLDVHLEELRSIYKTNAAIEVDSRYLIDFRRCSKFFTKLQDMNKYTVPSFEREHTRSYLAYLENQLRSVPMHSKLEDALEARSVQLQAQERLRHELRVDELRAIGFKP
ncbi:hypothetical protein PLICRDRAFT_42015 [Plicaturopsis crispa FD-325 SS-3]|nr:hypothetical protein PLICRDRAFT_42015 [Plicaturopsis crispa FD-325 SS-3]